ncbi:MAG TPA: hypothetical protein VFZ61_22715 [Polyangiales bacterium]
MPLIYIHGVRQRDPDGLKRLQTRFVTMLKQVAECVPSISSDFTVCIPYWGEVASRSEYPTVLPATLGKEPRGHIPPVDPTELGFEQERVPEDELETKGRVEPPPRQAEGRGGEESVAAAGAVDLSLLLAAERERPQSVEALIRSFASEGLEQDQLDALEDLLGQGWLSAYQESAPERGPDHGEELPAWANRHAINNLRGAVERAATTLALGVPGVRAWVDSAHRNFAMFTGDAMSYVMERERAGDDKPILRRILQAFDERQSGPLIVITHSMGGVIAYDCLTRFRPRLKIDCLITVGSQVSQFQNLGLLPQAVEKDPQGRITGLKHRVGTWINIFDPVDFLCFVASPVFADAVDVQFSSGRGPLEAHSAYWGPPRFYQLLADLLIKHLPGHAGDSG